MTNKPEFSHKVIYGMTTMGKTWWMKRRAKILLRQNERPVLVYSSVGDLSFPSGCKITQDEDQLETWLNDPENYGAFVFIDEAADLYEETSKKTHPLCWKITRRGRHRGFTAYIGTQFPTLLPTTVRRNASECVCFRLGDDDQANLVYKDWNKQDYNGQRIDKSILSLPKLHFFHMIKPDQIKLKRLA